MYVYVCMTLKESLEVDSSLESERVIQLTVLRLEGTIGRVVVTWRATATVYNSPGYIQPNNGNVMFHSAVILVNQIVL